MLLRRLKPEYWGIGGQYLIGFGGLCLALGLILDRFGERTTSNFLAGLLMGLSLVANVVGLVLFGRYKRNVVYRQSGLSTDTQI
jgi:hypothetical protein